jgi:putative FmdB family regulatory protein
VPTYEYECTKCGIVFDEFQSITAPPRQRCPACRGKVERLISGGSGIVFRGSGFYATDSRKSSPAAADKKGEGAAAAADTAPSPDGSADKKPAKKPAAKPAADKAPAS